MCSRHLSAPSAAFGLQALSSALVTSRRHRAHRDNERGGERTGVMERVAERAASRDEAVQREARDAGAEPRMEGDT